MNLIAKLSLLLLTALPLIGVEQNLQLGPDYLTLRGGFLSQQIDKGGARSTEPVIYALAGGRFNNFGLTGEGWIAMADDDDRAVEAGDNTEIRLRLDYLFEKEEFFQVIPHLEMSMYPSLPSSVEEPTWFGFDVWYLLPWEGLEVGGSIDFDVNDEYGMYGSIGLREFYQNSPFDLFAWQVINFGDGDFHSAWTGHDDPGLTTLELGVELTLPLPWEKTWINLSGEYHYWIMDDDRDHLPDDSYFVFGLTVVWNNRL